MWVGECADGIMSEGVACYDRRVGSIGRSRIRGMVPSRPGEMVTVGYGGLQTGE